MRPDVVVFTQHLEDAGYLNGFETKKWGIHESVFEASPEPFVIAWVSAAERIDSPTRYFFKIRLGNYPALAADICIWDPINNASLAESERPKGVGNVAMLFRTNWEMGLHLYAPYERQAIATHLDWNVTYKGLFWLSSDRIDKVFKDLYFHLNSADYHGK